mmetsp:Transcript_18004/g.44477  ORF Transcript_18004/g.44477 Transcript_18004/m.44477 type:complete len:567 (+) Transcript_18004:157-1857(+)|eukprot:CAMPEP_0113651234 /NCGR_PEP_ID=MMETSP0017_2-20120614/27298_1 /TAXON_ID=2856 /ORGANISM="Cylindrotheca closterium" /LENGTH=566 /DNA_ID=CAMNT_0000563869 /DNA_START=97 /DNA_END=1797 /DNA_ORIENTATION=- /assembly_acc=CAM_ASM_000147
MASNAPMQDTTTLSAPIDFGRQRTDCTIENMDALKEDLTKKDDIYANMSKEERLMKQEELSFYSTSTNDQGDDNIWGLLSGVGGNIYEWYDFAVYGLLSVEIGAAFFPQSSEKLQLINSFGVYLAAFLMRPIGAVLFGEIGDRLVGRKNALVFSILLITVPSVLMGILPGYASWGVFSPIILVVLRMFQGLSVGGQLAGSYVISIEQSSARSRGFRGSICDASSVGGFLLASAVTSSVRFVLTKEEVDDWGWRLPFLFSLLLAPILYNVVSHAEESKNWQEQQEDQQIQDFVDEEQEKNPAFIDLLSSPFRRRQLAGMVGTLSTCTGTFYILFLWTPVYLSELRGIMSQADADMMNFIAVGFYIICLIYMGRQSDSFTHRKDLIRIGLPGVIVAAPTMFGMFEADTWCGVLLAQLQLAACLAIVQGGMAAWEVELWINDPTLSFTGVAVGHNLSSTIFGGTMPLMATFLYYESESLLQDVDINDIFYKSLFPRLLPGLYISILASMSLFCVSFVVKHPHDLRIGSPQLRAAVEKENRKNIAAKKRRRKEMERRLKQEAPYAPPTIV